MASYIEAKLKIRISDASTFDPLVAIFDPDALNPGAGTYRYQIFEIGVPTTTATVELGAFTTVTNIFIKNTDPTNFLTATFRTALGGSNDQILRANAGHLLATGLVTVASDLVLDADTATIKALGLIMGT